MRIRLRGNQRVVMSIKTTRPLLVVVSCLQRKKLPMRNQLLIAGMALAFVLGSIDGIAKATLIASYDAGVAATAGTTGAANPIGQHRYCCSPLHSSRHHPVAPTRGLFSWTSILELATAERTLVRH